MKKVILDTNFIMACVKQKIDFFEGLRDLDLEIVIPDEVIGEIEKLEESGKKLHIRENAKLALQILGKNEFKRIKLGQEDVDFGLLKLSKEDKRFLVATIDRELKYKIDRPIVVIRGKKKIEII